MRIITLVIAFVIVSLSLSANVPPTHKDSKVEAIEIKAEPPSPKLVKPAPPTPAVAAPVVVPTPVATPAPAPAPIAPVSDCDTWMDEAGITDKADATILINMESHCNPTIVNGASGAYGIPQALPGSKMAASGSDWATNPVTQLKWMQYYVLTRYGSWGAAVAFHEVNNWY